MFGLQINFAMQAYQPCLSALQYIFALNKCRWINVFELNTIRHYRDLLRVVEIEDQRALAY